MTDNNISISIIMPAYKSMSTISSSINSVLAQSYTEWELIIIDDGKNAGIEKLINQYSDPRIILIQNIYQKGAAGARNSGIRFSRGRYLAFLDSDDLWHREKLKTQIEFMRHTGACFTYTDYYMFKDNYSPRLLISPNDSISYKDLIKKCDIGCLTVMLDKHKIPNISFPIIPKEDYALWLDILAKDIIAYRVPQALCYYRVSSTSISNNKRKEILKQWNILKKQNLPFPTRIICIITYIISGIYKHHFRLRHS